MTLKDRVRDFYGRKSRNFNKQRNINITDFDNLRQEIKTLYDSGLGLKILARDFLGLSYTQTRVLFQLMNIEMRRGRNVVTENVKQFRSEKAFREKKELRGAFDPNLKRRRSRSDRRGVQGYYWNLAMKKYVWLRSTYEFIFAEWLNRTNQNWDVETTCYQLSDGRLYRPDFFIRNSDGTESIVEIKGYFDSNTEKAQLLRKEHNIEVMIICGLTNIKKYLPNNISYEDALAKWKLERKGTVDLG